MNIPTATQLNSVSQLDTNPYATPRTLAVDDAHLNRRTNFQLQRLGFTLRAHAILTVATAAMFAAAFGMTYGPQPEIGVWLIVGLVFVSAAMALATVLLVFEVFPVPIAILVFASMFLIVTWPLSFIALHYWGRRVLKRHSMRVGFFNGPQYVAKLASNGS